MTQARERLLQEIAESAQGWVVPGTIRVQRDVEIMANGGEQILTRQLPGGDIPDEGDCIYFSSGNLSIPAFTSESDFDAYCAERSFNEEASTGTFLSVCYQMFGQTFAGEDAFLGAFESPAQVEEVTTALTVPVQTLIDAGLLAMPQQPDCAPEM